VKARRTDRGSVSVELAVLAPAFALMIALVLLVGRTQASRADVDAAAHAAARSITLSRDPTAAAEIAHEVTDARLQVGSSSCRTLGWDARITETEATVTLTCEVDLSEAALLPVPGSVSVSATSSEPMDRFRENAR
jgi:Flp pilus assembly protein TadG